jgi:hypothetical protein
MKLESEMNTATMISQIEKLLPPLQKREWALRKQRFQLKTRTGFHDMSVRFMIPTLHPFKTSVITRGSILTKSVKTSSII